MPEILDVKVRLWGVNISPLEANDCAMKLTPKQTQTCSGMQCN